MSTAHRLAKNTLFLTAASVGQKVVAFFYFAFIARTIGVENTGAYFLALAVITTIGVLDDLGLTSVLIREIAKTPARADVWLGNVLGYKLLAFPVTVLVAYLVPSFLGLGDQAVMLVRIAIAIMLADTISLTFYGVLRGLHLLTYESVGVVIGQLCTAVIGTTLILTGHATLPLLVGALIAGSAWNAVFSCVQVVRRLGIRALRPQYSLGRAPLVAASAFFLAAVFVKIYSYIDSFTLNAVIGSTAVGLYSVAYKLTYAFQFLPLAFVGALYPAMASHAHEPEKLRSIFLDAQWYLALLVSPIVFGIFALAPEIIAFFYGTSYAQSALPLSLLIFVLIPIFFDFPVGSLLNATGRQSTKTVIMGITMGVNALANIVLVPRLGIPGASLAGLMSFVCMYGMGWYMLPRDLHLSLRDLAQKVGGSLLAGAAMAVVVMLLKQVLPWMLTVPIGAAVFFLVVFGTHTLTAAHARALHTLVRPQTYASPSSND